MDDVQVWVTAAPLIEIRNWNELSQSFFFPLYLQGVLTDGIFPE